MAASASYNAFPLNRQQSRLQNEPYINLNDNIAEQTT